MAENGILSEMFSDSSSKAERAERLEAFKSVMGDAIEKGRSGKTRFDQGAKRLVTQERDSARAAEILDTISKSLTSDQASALETELAELKKDWTPTNPVNTVSGAIGGIGLTAYDLEAPAKQLVPQYTPLRNSIPRTKGVGNAHQYKRITSYTNAGITYGGGAPQLSPFFSSTNSANTSFGSNTGVGGGLSLNRPQKIAYTGDSIGVGYVELGFSDQVDYLSYFQGLGFEDLKALSHTALLWSHMMGEERAMLYGRGSGTGYEGAVTGLAVGTPTATGTGGPTNWPSSGSLYFGVTASTGFGETAVVASSAIGTLPTSGQVVQLPITEPVGAINYNLYAGTSSSTLKLVQAGVLPTLVSGSPVVTFSTYSTSGAAAPSTDTSASALSYDGILAVQSDPTKSAFVTRLNRVLSQSLTEFDTALSGMFVANGADPEEMWVTAAIRSELNQILRNGQENGYRINLQASGPNGTLGTMANGYVNPNTGRVMDINVHRFMPNGVILFRSTTINTPNNHIPAPVAAVNVQDYMAIDWPSIQMSYDTSTYQVGTLAHYAPEWSGVFLGVN